MINIFQSSADFIPFNRTMYSPYFQLPNKYKSNAQPIFIFFQSNICLQVVAM